MSFVLPDSAFGITATRFNVDLIPIDLPHRDALIAANEFNEHRFNKLTAKQRVFVTEYLSAGFDAQLAAIRTPGLLSGDFATAEDFQKEARRVGNRLLKKQFIAEAIDKALAYHTESKRIRIEDLIEELGIIAKFNSDDFLERDEHGHVLDVKLPEKGDPRFKALSEVTVETYTEGRGENAQQVKRVKYKAYSKLDAVEKLLKIAAASSDGKISPEAARDVKSEQSVQNIVFQVVNSGVHVPKPGEEHLVIEHDAAAGGDLKTSQPRELAHVVGTDQAFLFDAGAGKKMLDGMTVESIFPDKEE